MKNATYLFMNPKVMIVGGNFWFGTQMHIHHKLMAYQPKDGGGPKKKKTVKSFKMDIDCVTNEQFNDFVSSTNYVTEAEIFGWSFVLESTLFFLFMFSSLLQSLQIKLFLRFSIKKSHQKNR
jgi:formylglycine-generating enzyme required for sulfatase activity